jgi:hypothetical protein
LWSSWAGFNSHFSYSFLQWHFVDVYSLCCKNTNGYKAICIINLNTIIPICWYIMILIKYRCIESHSQDWLSVYKLYLNFFKNLRKIAKFSLLILNIIDSYSTNSIWIYDSGFLYNNTTIMWATRNAEYVVATPHGKRRYINSAATQLENFNGIFISHAGSESSYSDILELFVALAKDYQIFIFLICPSYTYENKLFRFDDIW